MKSEKTNKIYNAETEAWLRDGINTGKISKIDYTDTFGRDLTSNRLFISNGNRVCEFNKRSQTRGKPLLLVGSTITKVYREETIKERQALDAYYDGEFDEVQFDNNMSQVCGWNDPAIGDVEEIQED